MRKIVHRQCRESYSTYLLQLQYKHSPITPRMKINNTRPTVTAEMTALLLVGETAIARKREQK